MKKFLSNYKSTIILLVAIIVGAIVGIVFMLEIEGYIKKVAGGYKCI